VAQAEECLLCKPEAQSSNPSPTKKEGGRERERERRRGRERGRERKREREREISPKEQANYSYIPEQLVVKMWTIQPY
jgi:hypothetical protein